MNENMNCLVNSLLQLYMYKLCFILLLYFQISFYISNYRGFGVLGFADHFAVIPESSGENGAVCKKHGHARVAAHQWFH